MKNGLEIEKREKKTFLKCKQHTGEMEQQGRQCEIFCLHNFYTQSLENRNERNGERARKKKLFGLPIMRPLNIYFLLLVYQTNRFKFRGVLASRIPIQCGYCHLYRLFSKNDNDDNDDDYS